MSASANDNASSWANDLLVTTTAEEWFSIICDIEGTAKAYELRHQAHRFAARFSYLEEPKFVALLEHTFEFRHEDPAETVKVGPRAFIAIARQKRLALRNTPR